MDMVLRGLTWSSVLVYIDDIIIYATSYDELKAADYRDLGHYYRYLLQGSYPFTPPVQMFYGVQAALERMQEETMPTIWNRTHAMSRYFKEAAKAGGAHLFGDGSADALTF